MESRLGYPTVWDGKRWIHHKRHGRDMGKYRQTVVKVEELKCKIDPNGYNKRDQGMMETEPDEDYRRDLRQ